jgi:hypothetical protein
MFKLGEILMLVSYTALLRFHIQPINVVVYHGSIGRTSFEVSFFK